MFSLSDILEAHHKVKSGADFPAYIQAIRAMGVTHYETSVADGHIDYYGDNGYTASTDARYTPIDVAIKPSIEVFKAELLAHQQGKTDYDTFIKMCADTGVEKWKVDMHKMTCTYFDWEGNEVLTEHIPQ